MLLSFDVAPQAVAEHDDWHTHEHLPERLSIPGFVRGTRWTALRGAPAYFVMYEVEQLATLSSGAYLDRLNHPSPWTAQMMRHYRGMTRAFCCVAGSAGFGLGGFASLVRFAQAPAKELVGRDSLLREHLLSLPGLPGIGSAHWFEAALLPEMTVEQRIRGADVTMNAALLITGYREEALQDLLDSDFMHSLIAAHGADGTSVATYRLDYSLARTELEK
jgi:hypothetical protein